MVISSSDWNVYMKTVQVISSPDFVNGGVAFWHIQDMTGKYYWD